VKQKGSKVRKAIAMDLATRLINHGPVVMVASLFGKKVDVTPIAWHMPVEKDPPLIVLEIWEGHFIFDCIKKTGDFTVNILPSDFIKAIVKCGSVSGRDADKIKMCSFALSPSKKIKSPALAGAIGVLECVLVKDERLLKKYNMVLGKVKHAEVDGKAFKEHWLFGKKGAKTVHHLGNRTFSLSGGKVIDLRK